MRYMAIQPLSFRWPDEFVAAIDKARGDVPRTAYVRRAVEAALSGMDASRQVASESDNGTDRSAVGGSRPHQSAGARGSTPRPAAPPRARTKMVGCRKHPDAGASGAFCGEPGCGNFSREVSA